MQKEMWADILSHQLKGIMFHADAYGISALHGYKRLKHAHCKQIKSETGSFMCVREKSIDCLGEIIDIPAFTRIVIPAKATEKEIAGMWLKWEMEMAELFSKAMIEDPECKQWYRMHEDVSSEIRYISRCFD